MIYKHQARLAWIQLMEKLPRSTEGSPVSEHCGQMLPSSWCPQLTHRNNRQPYSWHVQVVLRTPWNKCWIWNKMLNIKSAQWIVASFSQAKMRQILSLSSQLSAPQAMLMHRLEHFPISWRIRILCSNLGTCLVNGLCALFVCCSILATPWSLNRVKRKVKIKLLL